MRTPLAALSNGSPRGVALCHIQTSLVLILLFSRKATEAAPPSTILPHSNNSQPTLSLSLFLFLPLSISLFLSFSSFALCVQVSQTIRVALVCREKWRGFGVTEGEFRPAKAHLDRLGLSKGGGTLLIQPPFFPTPSLSAHPLSLCLSPPLMCPSILYIYIYMSLYTSLYVYFHVYVSCHGNSPSLAAGVKRHWPAMAFDQSREFSPLSRPPSTIQPFAIYLATSSKLKQPFSAEFFFFFSSYRHSARLTFSGVRMSLSISGHDSSIIFEKIF